MFEQVQKEIERRKNIVEGVEGVKQNRKYNAKNVMGNLLECDECGAPYRRRTERGKVVYRCATRVEKGRDACKDSVTVEEEWIKRELGEGVCGGEYQEDIVRKRWRGFDRKRYSVKDIVQRLVTKSVINQ